MKMTNALFALVTSSLLLTIAAPAHATKAAPWGNGPSFGQGASGQNSGRGFLPGPTTTSGRMSLLQIASSLVPLGQVLEAINAQVPGSQLDTNTVIENGRPIYVVRWQASRGRIIIFRVDAETGQIIGRQG